MIDYIKLDVSDARDKIIMNPRLSFKRLINENTGEYEENRKAEFKNLVFVEKGKYLELKGSLHKLSNNALHNYNDFRFGDLVNTIIGLYNDFGINPYKTKIHNIEFGVNLIVPFKPRIFLRKQLINHKGQQKSKNFKINGKGYFVEFERNNYIFKLYDKGLQYNRPENILRFEVKTKKMEHIKLTGIKTLADLADVSKLKKLTPILLNTFNELLIYDSIGEKKLNDKEKEIYINGMNPNFWTNLKPDSEKFEFYSKDPQFKRRDKKYFRTIDNFQKLLEKHDLNRTKKTITELIEKKCGQLLSTDNKTREKLTDFLEIFNHDILVKKGEKLTGLSDINNIHLKVQINDSSIPSIYPYSFINFPSTDDVIIQGRKVNSYDRRKSEAVEQVIDNFYGYLYTGPETIDETLMKQFLKELKDDYGLILSSEEFFKYAKQLAPDLTCPF